MFDGVHHAGSENQVLNELSALSTIEAEKTIMDDKGTILNINLEILDVEYSNKIGQDYEEMENFKTDQ